MLLNATVTSSSQYSCILSGVNVITYIKQHFEKIESHHLNYIKTLT